MAVRAASKYKQVRITLTESAMSRKPGRSRLMIRVMVKPVEAQWSERDTILSTFADDLAPLATLDDVYAAILEFLAAPPLPGHIG